MINLSLIIIIIICGIIILYYNKLIRLRNKVKEAESGIDIYLNQRFDLIPNLVECVKGYTEHESTTLEDLVAKRTAYNKTEGLNIQEAEKINKEINHIMAVAENYPDLKASAQYLSLQNSLSKIEEQLNVARIEYNNKVTSYNDTVETIPSSIIAKMFAFDKMELFKIEQGKKENIEIDV